MPGPVEGAGERRGEAPGPDTRESFEVRFWKIRIYKGKRGRTHAVRWTVAGQEFHQAYETTALAESPLAELRTFAREGVAFDVETGPPAPALRQVRAAAAKATPVRWY